MKKFILLLIAVLFLFPLVSWGQTTVFSDDFSTNNNATYTTSGAIGSSSWSVTRAGADWGARINTSPAQLEQTNDVGTTTNVAGWVYTSAALSSFTSPYNATLSSNTGVVTWTFNFRTNRTTALAGFTSTTSYGMAMVLVSTSNTPNTSGSGYAVVMGGGGTNTIGLINFTSGLLGTKTTIVAFGGAPATLTNYMSVKVTYDPSSNSWQLYNRDDGNTAFSDPASGAFTSLGSATNNTYTGTEMSYLGAYWQGSTALTQTTFFDNVKVTVGSASTPTITVGSLTGFGNQTINTTSTEQSYTVSGSNLTADISITPPSGFEISTGTGGSFVVTNPITLTQSGGTVSSTTIYVRFAPTLVQSYSGNISHTSTDATTQNVAVSGTGINPVQYYRSVATGNWGNNTTWEVSSDSSSWSAAGTTYIPSNTDNSIAIRNGHTVTIDASKTADQLIINSGGQLTIASGQTLTIADGAGDDLIINGALVNTGTLTISSGVTWKINNGSTYVHNSTSSSSTLLSTSVTISSGSTWIYRGSSTLSTSVSISNRTFGNLTFESESGAWSPSSTGTNPLTINGDLSIGGTGAGTVSYSLSGFSGAIPVTGKITIVAGNSLTLGSSVLSVGGNWSNSGTFTPGTSTVTFSGTSAQTFTGTGSLYNLTVNNSLGLTLNNILTVTGTLTVTTGNVTSGSNVLTLGSSASSTGSLTRTSGRIIGNFERWFAAGTNTNFLFPVGTASNYRPVTISTASVATGGKILVSHTDGTDGTDLSSSVTDGSYTINKRSNMYWTLTGTTISGGTFDLSLDGSGQSGISDAAKLRILHSTDGSTFDLQGTHSDGSGTVANRLGIPIGTFDRFYIGSNTTDNPLPVQLISFSAYTNNKTVNLSWRTATEVNNYGFEIQRLAVSDKLLANSQEQNANSWSKIGFVNGHGNSNSPKNYSFTDEPYGGKVFKYRLKQIDFDGAFEYSDEVTAIFEDVTTFELEQNYPNPFNPSTKISYTIPQRSNVKLRVYNMLAQLEAELVNDSQEAGHYQVIFNGGNLPSGTYFYKLEAGKFVQVKKFLLVK